VPTTAIVSAAGVPVSIVVTTGCAVDRERPDQQVLSPPPGAFTATNSPPGRCRGARAPTVHWRGRRPSW